MSQLFASEQRKKHEISFFLVCSGTGFSQIVLRGLCSMLTLAVFLIVSFCAVMLGKILSMSSV